MNFIFGNMGDSIESIYEKYFQIIEDHYGRYFKRDDPISSVNSLLKNPMTARILFETSDTIIGEISQLFKRNSGKIRRDISDLEGINANYCGGLFPQNIRSYLAKTGLYVDTTIISDPLTFLDSIRRNISGKAGFSQILFENAFKMLDLKRALISDTEKPILRIIPRPIFWKEGMIEKREIEKQILDFFNQLFAKSFSTMAELNDFLEKNKSTQEIISNIKVKSILPPSLLSVRTLEEGFEDLYNDSILYGFPIRSAVDSFYSYVFGSIKGNISHLNFSKDFRLVNSFDSPNQWSYFRWILENESKKIDSKTFVLNSITLDKVKWMGNLELNDVVRARENSCLQDFREILCKEINYSDEDKSIDEIASQVNYNLRQAFKKHEKELKDIESNFNLAYLTSSTAIVGGTISLLEGIFTKNIISIIGGSAATFGSLASWIKANLNYNQKQKLINTPIGLLFEEAKNER